MSTTPSVTVLTAFANGRWLVQNRSTLATSIVAIDWIEDGIDALESEVVQELVNLAAFHGTLTASLIDRSWFADGVTETELEGVKYLGYIAYYSDAAARQVAELPWFVDGITETEVEAIDNLAYIAQSSEVITELIAGLPWFVDGITETEMEGTKYLGYIAYHNGAAAEQIAKMPFLTVIEAADVSAMEALADLAGLREDAFHQIMAHSSLAQGITDALAPVIAMLYGVAETNPSLTEKLLGSERVNIERRSITLPLTGDIDLVVVRTAPGAVRGMDLLEQSVRASEEFMGKPLPTRYVGLLYEDAVSGHYAGTNFGTHIAILPKYDVDDGSFNAEFAPESIAHEVAHYYWSGNADWVDEGAADFMASIVDGQRTGSPMGATRLPCPYFDDIAELESLATARGDTEFGCNYSLGERLFLDLYRSLGEERFRQGFQALYLASEIDDDADDRGGTSVGIEHIREAFRSEDGAEIAVIARWYDGNEPYDLSQLDPDKLDPALTSIDGRIVEAYVAASEDGPPVSSFSAQDASDWIILVIKYSYDVSGGLREIPLEIVEYYEDGFAFRRRTGSLTAESQYIGGTIRFSIGSPPSRKWASGGYVVYVYSGERNVAQVEYEITP